MIPSLADDVRGQIIGGNHKAVRLCSPAGREQFRRSFPAESTDEEIKRWANVYLKERLEEIGEEAAKNCGWDKQGWTIRIFD